MRLLPVAAASLISIAILFLLTKLIGYRQISQLSLYDYVNSVTLGSIAAQLAISTELSTALESALAMLIYGLATWGLALLSDKSRSARKIIVGHPVILMEKGKMYRENFSKVRLDLDEFESVCRINGYFDISKIDTALMEPNGMLSIIPKSTDRPVTPSDLALQPSQERLVANLIMDGERITENLQAAGYDRNWLKSRLKQAGVHDPQQVFLACCDENGVLNVYLKLPCEKQQKRNVL